jgi:uncharacterized membrane protein
MQSGFIIRHCKKYVAVSIQTFTVGPGYVILAFLLDVLFIPLAAHRCRPTMYSILLRIAFILRGYMTSIGDKLETGFEILSSSHNLLKKKRVLLQATTSYAGLGVLI